MNAPVEHHCAFGILRCLLFHLFLFTPEPDRTKRLHHFTVWGTRRTELRCEEKVTCSVRRPPTPQRATPPEAPRPDSGGSAAGPLGSETARTPGYTQKKKNSHEPSCLAAGRLT